jgi:starvation-inducible DNA-binding protein
MIRRLMDANRNCLEQHRTAHEACEEAGDIATASLLEDVIDATEKRVWFLFEYLQDTDRFD